MPVRLNICAVVAAGLIAGLVAVPSSADDRSMRCVTSRVFAGAGDDGSSMYEVLKKCGEPATKERNVWIYRQGGVVRRLTFNYEGRLVRIQSERF